MILKMTNSAQYTTYNCRHMYKQKTNNSYLNNVMIQLSSLSSCLLMILSFIYINFHYTLPCLTYKILQQFAKLKVTHCPIVTMLNDRTEVWFKILCLHCVATGSAYIMIWTCDTMLE